MATAVTRRVKGCATGWRFLDEESRVDWHKRERTDCGSTEAMWCSLLLACGAALLLRDSRILSEGRIAWRVSHDAVCTNRKIWLSLSASVLKGKHSTSAPEPLALGPEHAHFPPRVDVSDRVFIMTDKGRPLECSVFTFAITVCTNFPQQPNSTVVKVERWLL
ncbi:hypothetical protein Q8A67_023984 [Cirrhinus molitorella]|uniref:Uncharacterized protein n=1 Tax=Cirrhinus molitorella TaxID=172907 RepID=A0AA88P5Q9_9TELE|nr:hypothetical protein Q8A67_023984 [Cirrhinus molitorella]